MNKEDWVKTKGIVDRLFEMGDCYIDEMDNGVTVIFPIGEWDPFQTHIKFRFDDDLQNPFDTVISKISFDVETVSKKQEIYLYEKYSKNTEEYTIPKIEDAFNKLKELLDDEKRIS